VRRKLTLLLYSQLAFPFSLGSMFCRSLVYLRSRLSSFVWLVSMLAPGALQPANAQSNPFQLAQQQLIGRDSSLNYVAPLQALLANKHLFDAASIEDGPYAQALATYYSFVGKAEKPAASTLAPAMQPYKLVPVEPLLVARARATSVVLLNEGHDQPAHRVYCRQVLAQLAPLGYHYFAVEALTPEATGLNERGFPLSSSGFYTCEPSMGNLLRAATEAGFYVFGHELKESQEKEFADWRQRSNYRDSMQAVNILAVLRAHPQAKVFAYVGYGHVREKADEGLKCLATYLRELGNINPLTIDQTVVYPSAKKAGLLALTSASGTPATIGIYQGAVDLQVVHPPVTWVNNRPDWLATTAPIVATIPPPYAGKPALAQLYDQAEYTRYGERAVPLDQYLTTKTQEKVYLFPYQKARKTLIKYKVAELSE
jgi:hypothetical protein